MTTCDIVAKLWNLCNILKDDGVTYHQYVAELIYLLFLKTARKTGSENQQPNYQTARKYWNTLKGRLDKEGSESVTKCHRLKSPAVRQESAEQEMTTRSASITA